MLKHTRRRALGLIVAGAAGLHLFPPTRRAFAAKEPNCYAAKDFGPWKGQATNASAGARMSLLPLEGTDCDLRADVKVASSYDAKLVVYGDPFGTRLPKKFLIKPENRFIAKASDGTEAVNEPLCGNCTDIFDDKVSIVLPLATAPLLRDGDSTTFSVKLGNKEACELKLDCVTLRQALDWAVARRDTFAQQLAEAKCTAPEEECFITTACCQVLGLDDDCFELRTLRRYRDEVLAKRPGGVAAIARYYEVAPQILKRLPEETRRPRLISVYARYVLPSALAARFGLNALAYCFYVRMIEELHSNGCGRMSPLPWRQTGEHDGLD
jgi:hypothetical protein